MSYDQEVLQRITQKMRNKCHICHHRLVVAGYRSGWQVDLGALIGNDATVQG